MRDDFAREEHLDYGEIYRRGGENLGGEDFALFKCPFCDCVYLMDYEVPTVYFDGLDLSRRADPTPSFHCVGCGQRLPDDKAWVGENPAPKFRVSWELLAGSDWAWTVARLRESDD